MRPGWCNENTVLCSLLILIAFLKHFSQLHLAYGSTYAPGLSHGPQLFAFLKQTPSQVAPVHTLLSIPTTTAHIVSQSPPPALFPCPPPPPHQILHDEAPLPPSGSCSEELRDFIRCCLALDPKRRPRAEQLLQHPFISRHTAPLSPAPPGGGPPMHDAQSAEAKRFMACMLDPLEK